MTQDAINAAEELKRRQRRQLITNAYHRVFGVKSDGKPLNEDGALILEDLEETFHFSKPAFLGSDTILAAIRDGERRIKIHIDGHLSLPLIADGNLREQPKVITE